MTSTEFIQDGIRYVPSKAAAKGVGLSPDYISRLCREGQVLGVWHRGAWYVHDQSLQRFTEEKRKRQEELAQAQAEKLKREREQAEAAARNAKAIATWRRRARPVALATITLLIATSAAALARPAFEHIAPQLPSDAKAQLASVATSLETLREIASNIASSITDKIGNFLAPVETAPTPIVFVPKLIATPIPSQTAQTDLQPPSQTVINQPVIERVVESVRTIVSGGISEAFLDARLAALDQDLSIRMNQVALAGAYQTNRTYDVLATALRIEEFADLILHRPRIDGGTITGATITGGSLSGVALDIDAGDIGGVLGVAQGGTGTTTSPSYGRLLVGNALGGYDLVATSSLGISGGSGGASFGQTWQIANDALAPTTTLGIIVSASSTFTGGLSATDATTTNATSTSLFASLARFTTGIVETLTATIATITNLTATTLTAQNASTTVASAYDGIFVGRTATTTIRGNATSTFAAGIETVALNVTSSSATSTFANGIQLAGGCFRDASASCITSGGGSTAWGTITGTLSDQTDLQSALDAKFSLTDWYATTTDGLLQGSSNLYYSDTPVNAFLHSSTTIPKTYTANAFTALQTFGNASTTNLSASYASSTQGFFGSLSVANLTGFLKATAGAIAAAAIDLAADVTGILGVARGGTGWSAVQAGSLLYGDGANALATTSAGTAGQVLALLNGVPTWTATTTFSSPLLYANGNVTLDTSGDWSGTFDGEEGSYYLNAANLTNFGVPFYSFFSATTTSALAEGSNLYWTNTRFDTRLAATTSLPNLTTLAGLSITESQISDLTHYTDADTQAFVHSSTTIPKTYTSNIFTGSNSFSSLTLGSLNGPLHANAGVLSATTSIGVLYGGTGLTSAPSYGQVLLGQSNGTYQLVATSSLGITGGASTFDYPFPSNATTTLLYFNSGLLSLASSTIGNGTQAGGLTISGGATTTGFLVVQGTATSTFAAGIQSTALNITSSSATSTFANGIRISAGCFAINDTCITGGGGSGTVGSGTTGEFPYYAANGTTLSATSSLFLASSGNIGVGTTGPERKLHVSDASDASAQFTTSGSGHTFTDGLYVGYASQGWVWNYENTALSFGTNDLERLTVTAAGNVGIGTTSPAALLHLDAFASADTIALLTNGIGLEVGLEANNNGNAYLGTYTAHPLNFFTNDDVAMTINTSGNVGIGTTSPWARLSIESNGLGSTPAFAIGSSTATHFVVTNGGRVGIGTPTPATDAWFTINDANETYGFNHTDGTLRIVSWVGTDGRLTGQFGTGTNHPFDVITNNTIRMSFDTAGNVGIGTTSPASALHLRNTSGSHGDLLRIANNGEIQFLIEDLSQADGSAPFKYIQSTGGGMFFGSANRSAGAPTGWVDQMTIDSSGNVGIGTTTPNSILTLVDADPILLIKDSETGINSANSRIRFAESAGGGATDNYWDAGMGIGANGDFDYSILRNTTEMLTLRRNDGQLGIGTTTPWAKLSVTNAGSYPSFLVEDTSSPDSSPFIIDASGNVGIGTTSPNYKLHVSGNVLTEGDELIVSNPVGSGGYLGTYLHVIADGTNQVVNLQGYGFLPSEDFRDIALQAEGGNVGIGTTSPRGPMQVEASDAVMTFFDTDGAMSSSRPAWTFGPDAANLEIGTISAYSGGTINNDITARLTMTPTGGFSLTSGITQAQTGHVLCINSSTFEVVRDSSPASPCTSSLRANKENITDLSEGLDAVMRLRPVEFNWKPGFGEGHDLGFIAEEVATSVPLLADYDPETGQLTSVKYMNMPALLTKAIQQIAAISGTFKQNLIAWLADATNGIASIVADTFTGRLFKGERGEFEELCVGSVCVTEADFMANFGAAASAAPPISVPFSPSEIREPEGPLSVSTPDLTGIEQPDNLSGQKANSTTSPALKQQSANAISPPPANDNSPTDQSAPATDSIQPDAQPDDSELDEAA